MDELPIFAGVLLATVLLIGRRGPRLQPVWLWGALPLLMAGLCLPKQLSLLGSAQYNLVELLRPDRMFPGARLALLCLWGPLTASLCARTWNNGFRLRAVCWTPASCLVAWGLLRRSVTVESIDEILGAPVLSWPADLEYIARLSVVYLLFLWLPLLLTLLFTRSGRWLLAASAYSAALVVLSPVIVNGFSSSDNVPELFRADGHAWFAALCLLAPWAAVACDRVRRSAGLPAAAVALAVISPSAYAMLNRALRLGEIHGLALTPLMIIAAFAAMVATCLVPAVASVRHELAQHDAVKARV